jgi:hypothetical protein
MRPGRATREAFSCPRGEVSGRDVRWGHRFRVQGVDPIEAGRDPSMLARSKRYLDTRLRYRSCILGLFLRPDKSTTRKRSYTRTLFRDRAGQLLDVGVVISSHAKARRYSSGLTRIATVPGPGGSAKPLRGA